MPISERPARPSVLIFLHSFEPGGVERIALRLAARWRETGLPVAVFMGRADGAMASQFAQGSHIVRAPRSRLPIRHFETLWMIVQLYRHIRVSRPDLLFPAGNSYAVVAVAMKWLLGKACPPIAMKVSNDLVRRDMSAPMALLYGLWLRIQGRHIDHLVAMSSPLAAQIAREMKVPRDRISVIANPSLNSMGGIPWTSERRREAGRSFCAVGRLTRQKNLAAMLRAFALGARPEDRLTLYGDGPERRSLEALVQRLGIVEKVTFAGFVPDPQAELFHHDVLMLSSSYEGMPSAVLEALDAGLHVIATDCCCSMAWLLDAGRLGTLVPTGDEAALALAIAHAPRGQQAPAQARARADLHRMDQVAPAYVRLFAMASREWCGGAVGHPSPSLVTGTL